MQRGPPASGADCAACTGARQPVTLTVLRAAGSSSQEDVEPQERKGALWECYRQLLSEGWTPDVHSYTTSFRWGL